MWIVGMLFILIMVGFIFRGVVMWTCEWLFNGSGVRHRLARRAVGFYLDNTAYAICIVRYFVVRFELHASLIWLGLLGCSSIFCIPL